MVCEFTEGIFDNGKRLQQDTGIILRTVRNNPQKILDDAKSGKLRKDFERIVGKWEGAGKKSSYIARFRKSLNSWCSYNDIDARLNSVVVSRVGFAHILVNESSPTQEQVATLLRKGSVRARTIISLFAFYDLRPESIGNYNGSDGLRTGEKCTRELLTCQDKEI